MKKTLSSLADQDYDIKERRTISENKNNYATILRKLDEYFKSKINLCYETNVFRQLKQIPTRSILHTDEGKHGN